MRSVDSRLKKLENVKSRAFSDVLSLIREGRYYDELDDHQKDRYFQYHGHDRKATEEVYTMICSSFDRDPLHFKLEYKKRPPTRAEFEERVREVEAIFREYEEEYNSPEAKAKREAEYQELKRIGELRRQAFMRGEPMDKYPLPWEKKSEGGDIDD